MYSWPRSSCNPHTTSSQTLNSDLTVPPARSLVVGNLAQEPHVKFMTAFHSSVAAPLLVDDQELVKEEPMVALLKHLIHG